MSDEINENVDSNESESTIETPKVGFDLTEPDLVQGESKSDLSKVLCLLNQSVKEVTDAIRDIKVNTLPGSAEHIAKYRDVITEAIRHHPILGYDNNAFDRPDALWKHKVDHEGAIIGPYKPIYKVANSGLSGEHAILRARQSAQLGTQLGFPFWRSGIWLKLRAPSESTILELERRVAMEKIALGRSTLGAALTSTSIYMQSHVVDTILNHVVDGSYYTLEPSELKKVIKVSDLMPLVTAWASTIWPDSYPYAHPCVKDPSKCTHISEGEIFIKRLFKTDNRAVSVVQRNHMSDREANYKLDDLNKYQSEHKVLTRTVALNDDVSIVLKEPSIHEMELSSFKWIEDIVSNVDSAFTQELRGEQRNQYIADQGKASNLRRFSHWIKEIQYSDGSVVTEREGIDGSLTVWSSVDKMSKAIKEAVATFSRDVVITAIGFAKYDCPACKGESPENLPNHVEVIPIDALSVFFTLLRMRATSVLEADY